MNAISASPSSTKSSESSLHEPSMEEILASIRRIIADDRGGAAAGVKSASPAEESAAVFSPPSNMSASPERGTGSSAGAEKRNSAWALEGASFPSNMPPNVPPPFAEALPDSSFKREPSLSQGVEQRPEWPGSQEALSGGAFWSSLNSVGESAVHHRPAPEAIPSSPTGGSRNESCGAPQNNVLQKGERPGSSHEVPYGQFNAPLSPDNLRGMGEKERNRVSESFKEKPLLSPNADASIASCFEALKTSVLVQNTELIENTVRDMLKPLLCQWLDDHLPRMVEKLIREEIERVARGPYSR